MFCILATSCRYLILFAAIIFPPEDEIIYLFRKLEVKKTILEVFKSPLQNVITKLTFLASSSAHLVKATTVFLSSVPGVPSTCPLLLGSHSNISCSHSSTSRLKNNVRIFFQEKLYLKNFNIKNKDSMLENILTRATAEERAGWDKPCQDNKRKTALTQWNILEFDVLCTYSRRLASNLSNSRISALSSLNYTFLISI